MLFTFKRDDEGRETIEVGGVRLVIGQSLRRGWRWLDYVHGVLAEHINEAIERADAGGFWTPLMPYPPLNVPPSICTVDVPIAETTVLSVTLDGEDQS